MCSGGDGAIKKKNLEIASRIYIPWEDPANCPSGTRLSGKSHVSCPATPGDTCAAEAANSGPGHHQGSAVSPGTPHLHHHQDCTLWEPRRVRTSALHVAKPSPNCRGLNFVTSMFLTGTLPPTKRHGPSSWAGPPGKCTWGIFSGSG